jgi:endonuclease/exonuclease/phosphatase family metal-dependent hydrolase
MLWPAFFGLAYIPILLVNLSFVIFWALAKPRMMVMGLIGILLTWGSIERHFSFWSNTSASKEESLKLMSFNVRLFDLYNWGGNKVTRDQIFDFLASEQPSILCFQEFFNTNNPKYFNTLDTLVQILDCKLVHEHYTAVMHYGKSKFGIATFSAFPILNKALIPLDTAANNAAIYTDVIIHNDTVRVFNIHLASVYISGIEEDLSEHIEHNDQDGQMRDIQRMTKRLSGGFKRRANQADVIRTFIDSSPYPVLVCGDLNDTPGSYAYARLSEGLEDAFTSYGSGLGTTYIGLFPGLRIDFILVDPRIDLSSFETFDVSLSDHRPIQAQISLP